MGRIRDWQLDAELRPLVRATALSAVFLLVGWVLERPALGLPAWVAMASYLLAYLAGGYLRVVDGLEALRKGSLNIDMLMVLGAMGAAFLGRWSEGAVLIFLFALSNALEEYAAGRTRKAIESLMTLRPESARVRRPGGEEDLIPVEELRVGDLVIVRPGERLAADGEIVEGRSALDQQVITGESVPVDKEPGMPVFAGSLNTNGRLVVRVTKLATESTLARIISLVEEAQEHKAKSQQLVDWIDRYYTLAVVAVALIAWIAPPLVSGWGWSDSFYLAMQLLVVMSPCALVIATPAALLSGVAAGARRGILFKGGAYLERAGQIKVVAFDKTGTLTEGKPRLKSLQAAPGVSEAELLRLAAAAEEHSGHPLATAIVAAARERFGGIPSADHVVEQPGMGVTAQVLGREVRVGSRRLATATGSDWLLGQADLIEDQGQTAVLVQVDGQPFGVIGIADTVRVNARAAIAALHALGVEKIIMLTGDNDRVAATVAAQVGVDQYQAGLLPAEKLEYVRALERTYGHVAMVGDGINDAPALAQASLGIAMGGAGNDAALESADVVLMADDLSKVSEAFRLGRAARSVVAQNLIFAAAVIVALVGFSLTDGLTLPLAVVGHEGSTILVAMNGMRLLLRGLGRASQPSGPSQQAARQSEA